MYKFSKLCHSFRSPIYGCYTSVLYRLNKTAKILDKIFGATNRNAVKLDKTRKVWYLLLRVFWLPQPKFNFWKWGRALYYAICYTTLYYISSQIWDFPNISFISMIRSLKSSGKLWENSYTKFAILDIMFRFNSG